MEIYSIKTIHKGEIVMKRKFIALLIAASLATMPVYVHADAKDEKITELESKIVDLEKQIKDLEEELSKYESKSNAGIESYLLEKKLLSGERIEMAADMVGAVSGFKYGNTEIYEYDIESENYKNLITENKITLKDFGIDLIPLAVNDKYVIFGEASEELITAFKDFKEE